MTELKKTKKIKKVAPAVKAKKPKVKWLSDEPTFGAIVPSNQSQAVEGGFVYKMILTHEKAPGVEYIYCGQKHWNKGKSWSHYQSSSEKVINLLQLGFKAQYTIIDYCLTSIGLNRLESLHIALQWATPALRDFSLNFGINLSGTKMSRYLYCKNILKQHDPRY
jgi:hypothetical protein